MLHTSARTCSPTRPPTNAFTPKPSSDPSSKTPSSAMLIDLERDKKKRFSSHSNSDCRVHFQGRLHSKSRLHSESRLNAVKGNHITITTTSTRVTFILQGKMPRDAGGLLASMSMPLTHIRTIDDFRIATSTTLRAETRTIRDCVVNYCNEKLDPGVSGNDCTMYTDRNTTPTNSIEKDVDSVAVKDVSTRVHVQPQTIKTSDALTR